MLDLSASDYPLEIGTGWGGSAVHGAPQTGCQITTTTISAEQYAFARQRVADAGLGSQVEVPDTDHRHLIRLIPGICTRPGESKAQSARWRSHAVSIGRPRPS